MKLFYLLTFIIVSIQYSYSSDSEEALDNPLSQGLTVDMCYISPECFPTVRPDEVDFFPGKGSADTNPEEIYDALLMHASPLFASVDLDFYKKKKALLNFDPFKKGYEKQEQELSALFVRAYWPTFIIKYFFGLESYYDIKEMIPPELYFYSGQDILRLFFKNVSQIPDVLRINFSGYIDYENWMQEGNITLSVFKEAYGKWNTDSERVFEDYLEQFYGNFSPLTEEEIAKDEVRFSYYLKRPLCQLSQSVIKDAFNAARRILAYTKHGETVVIFGNSPYYIGRILEKMVSDDKDNPSFRKIIFFPFSGSPNSEDRGATGAIDIVTHRRLDYLKKRMQEFGLISKETPPKNTMHFVDLIRRGRGIYYVMRVMFAYYKTVALKLNVIALAEISGAKEFEEEAIVRENLCDGEKGTLSFPSVECTQHKINCTVLGLNEDTASILDVDLDSFPNMRMVPKANPFLWHTDYNFLWEREKKPMQKMVLEYFDTNVIKLLSDQR